MPRGFKNMAVSEWRKSKEPSHPELSQAPGDFKMPFPVAMSIRT